MQRIDQIISSGLKHKGFCKFRLQGILNAHDLERFDALMDGAFEKVRVDPYDHSGTRSRCYVRYFYIPEQDSLLRCCHRLDANGLWTTEYKQTHEFHPDPMVADRERVFASLNQQDSEALGSLPLIRRLFSILLDAEILPSRGIFVVGVHFIRLSVSDRSKLAAASPNCIHRDGELITCGVLVRRENVVGGENIIAVPSAAGKRPDQLLADELIDTTTLLLRGDSWIIDDRRVSHHVGEIAVGPDGDQATRDIVLIDFMPMRTILSSEYAA